MIRIPSRPLISLLTILRVCGPSGSLCVSRSKVTGDWNSPSGSGLSSRKRVTVAFVCTEDLDAGCAASVLVVTVFKGKDGPFDVIVVFLARTEEEFQRIDERDDNDHRSDCDKNPIDDSARRETMC